MSLTTILFLIVIVLLFIVYFEVNKKPEQTTDEVEHKYEDLISQLQKQLKEKSLEYEKLKTQHTALESRERETKVSSLSSLNVLKQQLHDVNLQHDASRASQKLLVQKNMEMESEIKQLLIRVSQLTSENVEKTKEFDQLESLYDYKLNKEITTLVASRDLQIANLEARLRAEEESNTKIKQITDALVANATKNMTEYTIQIEQLKAELADEKVDLETTKTSLHEKGIELQSLKGDRMDLKKKLECTELEFEETKMALTEYHENESKITKEKESLSEQVNALNEEKLALNSHVESLKSEATTLKSEVASLTLEVDSLKTTVNSLENEINDLKAASIKQLPDKEKEDNGTQVAVKEGESETNNSKLDEEEFQVEKVSEIPDAIEPKVDMEKGTPIEEHILKTDESKRGNDEEIQSSKEAHTSQFKIETLPTSETNEVQEERQEKVSDTETDEKELTDSDINIESSKQNGSKLGIFLHATEGTDNNLGDQSDAVQVQNEHDNNDFEETKEGQAPDKRNARDLKKSEIIEPQDGKSPAEIEELKDTEQESIPDLEEAEAGSNVTLNATISNENKSKDLNETTMEKTIDDDVKSLANELNTDKVERGDNFLSEEAKEEPPEELPDENQDSKRETVIEDQNVSKTTSDAQIAPEATKPKTSEEVKEPLENVIPSQKKLNEEWEQENAAAITKLQDKIVQLQNSVEGTESDTTCTELLKALKDRIEIETNRAQDLKSKLDLHEAAENVKTQAMREQLQTLENRNEILNQKVEELEASSKVLKSNLANQDILTTNNKANDVEHKTDDSGVDMQEEGMITDKDDKVIQDDNEDEENEQLMDDENIIKAQATTGMSPLKRSPNKKNKKKKNKKSLTTF